MGKTPWNLKQCNTESPQEETIHHLPDVAEQFRNFKCHFQKEQRNKGHSERSKRYGFRNKTTLIDQLGLQENIMQNSSSILTFLFNIIRTYNINTCICIFHNLHFRTSYETGAGIFN